MPRWTEQQLRDAVAVSDSYSDVLRHFGLRTAGGNAGTVLRWAERWDISMEHFTHGANRLVGRPRQARPLDEVLVEHSTYGRGSLKKRLYDAGVRLCTGNDGIRDAWGPLNMPDMLLRAFIIAYRNNLRRDDEIEMVLDIATHGGARVLGDTAYGLGLGNRADLVLVPGETHVEAVIERPARWLVLKGGRIVARDGVCLV